VLKFLGAKTVRAQMWCQNGGAQMSCSEELLYGKL